jgi:hypothetical protein
MSLKVIKLFCVGQESKYLSDIISSKNGTATITHSSYHLHPISMWFLKVWVLRLNIYGYCT